MSEELERIKGKINKLLKLAEGAKNEHEAANAASKARALMDKYQLDQVDILNVDGIDKEFLAAAATRSFAALPKHMSFLAVAVAKFNDVQAIGDWADVDFKMHLKVNKGAAKTQGRVLKFRGLRSDVEMAVDMYARLLGAVNRLCAEWLVDSGHTGRYPVKEGGKFKLGAVARLCEMLAKMQIDRQKLTTTSGTSLVVVKGNAVAEYFGEVKYASGNYGQNKMDNDASNAFAEGQRRANSIEVLRSVTDQ